MRGSCRACDGQFRRGGNYRRSADGQARVPPSDFASRILDIEVGGTTDPDDMIEKLAEMGYGKVPQVMERGEFARRGDIIDIFPPDMNEPVRISFFDDEIDQLKNFDLETQRSTEMLKDVRIIPVRCIPRVEERAQRRRRKDPRSG